MNPTASFDAWSGGVLDPHGPVAAAQRTILLDATVIMLAVIVPVIVLTLAFAWWFRAGNSWARRRPDWAYSGPVEVTVWAIPILVVLFIGGMGWVGAHTLDPGRRIAGPGPALEVQVVSLDWKWLFIYPELGIASVNRLALPVGVPVHLQLTSASVMNSFFVPQIGSQIYTMAGMTTTLNLRADQAGRYAGLSAQFSGAGFSDMRFEALALPPAAFARWQAGVRAAGPALDERRYRELARPAVAPAPLAFGHVAPRLFDTIERRAVAPEAAASVCAALQD